MKTKLLFTSFSVLIASVANAALIITTPTSPFVVVSGPTAQNINLNSDLGPTGDTTIDLSITVTDLSAFFLGKALAVNRSVSGATGSFAKDPGTGAPGDPLALAIPFGGNVTSALTYDINPTFLALTTDPSAQWTSVNPDAYLGVQFQIGSNTHYGWVHVVWNEAIARATIDQYAYESTPNTTAPITAIPEPSSAMILGLIGAGMIFRRRA